METQVGHNMQELHAAGDSYKVFLHEDDDVISVDLPSNYLRI